MLNLLIVEKRQFVTESNFHYYGQTESGDVPDRFYAYPDANGDKILIEVYPLKASPQELEAHKAQNPDWEQVTVWSSDALVFPKGSDVTWFAVHRPPRGSNLH